jgi:putative salt-induced outer membrane protein
MLRTVLILATTAVTICSAHAQTAPQPDGEWRGAFGVGVTATSGNTDSVTYSISGDTVRQTPVDKITGYVQAVNGHRDVDGTSEHTANQARAGTAYTRDLNDRLFGFGGVDLDRNVLIQLELRSVVSAGLGYHVVKTEGHTFDVSTGPAHNRERYTTERRLVNEWLIAEESTHALSSAVSFKQKLAAYANLTDGGEYRGVFDTGMVFKVSSRWNATMTFNARYQSNPLPGTKTYDTLFVTGLQYVFNPPASPPPKPDAPAAASATCGLIHCSDSGGIP